MCSSRTGNRLAPEKNLVPAVMQRVSMRLLLSGLFWWALLWGGATQAVELVANPSVPVKTVTVNEARALFYMRKSEWPDGAPITVFVLKDDNPLHRQFSKQQLRLFPYRLRRVWDRHLFSGTGRVPEALENSREMINEIASTPGAVGYVDKESIDERVQVIEIHK